MQYIEYFKQLFQRNIQIPDFAGMTGFGAFCLFSDRLKGGSKASGDKSLAYRADFGFKTEAESDSQAIQAIMAII